MDVPHGTKSTSLSGALWELVKDFFWDEGGAFFQEWLRIFAPRNEDWQSTSGAAGIEAYRCLSDLNSKSFARSCLHVAASYGLVDILEWSHPNGLDFDIRDAVGVTPLMYATFVGDEDATKAILSKPGVQVNQTRCGSPEKGKYCKMDCGTLGGTALECAAWFHRLDVLMLLLRHPGTELDLVCHGNTALGAAIDAEFTEGIELLVDAGARVAMFGGDVLTIPLLP
jgi:ankyrin repeat protein